MVTSCHDPHGQMSKHMKQADAATTSFEQLKLKTCIITLPRALDPMFATALQAEIWKYVS